MEKKRKHAEFLILMALTDGPKHGYEVSKFIESKSKGFFKMPFGTVYPILHKLEKLSYVTVETKDAASARPKKVYKLTRAGKQQASNDVESFQMFYKATSRLVP